MSDKVKRLPLTSGKVKGINGKIKVAGDKSISHRSVMLSSLAIGKTTISGLLEGDDVLNTKQAMLQLGVDINKDENGIWTVKGSGIGGLTESQDIIDMGNSGTGARLLMGILSTHKLFSVITGDASLRKRPMMRVIDPLSKFGARFYFRSGGRLPIAVCGTEEPLPVTYELPVASAQVKSAVLLAGLNTAGITTVIEKEKTRDHTERMLKFFGADIHVDGDNIKLKGQPLLKSDNLHINVPADPSSAAFPIVAALITKNSDITIENVCINPLRTGLFQTLKEMGADIEYLNIRSECGEEIADIRVKSSHLKGIEVPADRAPSMIDEYPILAVAAAFAEGKTVMRGLEELRVKESDRLLAVANGLNVCGVKNQIDGNDLTVFGGKVAGGNTVVTHMDHRIAMSFLVMGMSSANPISVDDGSFIATSFPDFIKLMNQIGARIVSATNTNENKEDKPSYYNINNIRPLVIAIDGPAASGKGTLARRIANTLGFSYLDTGSLYRAVGLKLVYAGIEPEQIKDNVDIAIDCARNITQDDLSNPRLRQERIGRAASIVAAMPEIRAALLEYQREYAKKSGGAVLDGRDIGTVVCPDADIKLFITASLGSRAKRRHKEIQGQGIEVVFSSVLKDLEERDQRDRERDQAPMQPADDAIIIDTTASSANDVFDKVMGLIAQKSGSNNI